MAPKKGCSKKRKIEEVILIKQRNNLTTTMRTKRENRPWSDLPADLLIDIMVRNYSRADQIRFRAVCKSWQQLPIGHVDNSEINMLPWVVTGNWSENLVEEEEEEEEYCINNNNNDTSSEMSSCVWNCKLFHPKHPNPYSINKILFKDRRTTICSSKHGWLLFEKEKHSNNLTSYFFLFSPFTQQIIHLPDLDNFIPGLKSSSSSHVSYATFSSSDPYKDPDCEFFVLRDCFYRDCNYGNCNRIAVSTCRRGDQNWTTRVFDKRNIQVNWIEKIRQMLYSTQLGYLCCLFGFNTLVAYSVTRKDWIQLTDPQQMQVFNEMFFGRPQLIECEGGLLLVIARNNRNYDDGCCLFKFSWSSSDWNIKSSLPNHAIFVGPTSFLVPASGDITNKIYYYDLQSENLKFYCLKDRQSHKYLRAAADDSLRRRWLAKGMLKIRAMWIQSP